MSIQTRLGIDDSPSPSFFSSKSRREEADQTEETIEGTRESTLCFFDQHRDRSCKERCQHRERLVEEISIIMTT